MAHRKFRHRPEAVRKIKDKMRYIRSMIETNGSYRCSTGRVITRLGNPNGAACLAGRGNKESNAVQQAKADEFALKIAPIIAKIQATWSGPRPPSLRQLAEELALRDVASYRGTIWQWKATTVRRLLQRLARLRGETRSKG